MTKKMIKELMKKHLMGGEKIIDIEIDDIFFEARIITKCKTTLYQYELSYIFGDTEEPKIEYVGALVPKIH